MTIHEKLSTIELRASAASHLAWLLNVVSPADMKSPSTIRQMRTALTEALRLLDEIEMEVK